jgi:hypothetical protein
MISRQLSRENRVSRYHETRNTVLVQSNSEPRMSMVNGQRVEISPLAPGDPRSYVTLGFHRSRIHDASFPKVEKPRTSNPDSPIPRIWRHMSLFLIQVDIGGHPPFPTGSKQFSGNFGNLLFLAGFNFRGHFEGLNEGFLRSRFSMIAEGMIEPPK